MVTYYNRKDLVSFGAYLLSEKRKAKFNEVPHWGDKIDFKGLTSEERMKMVHHADIENWKSEQKSN